MTKSNQRAGAKPIASLLYPQELVVPAVPPHGVKLEENIYVTMRDGVKIAVDIYRPEKDGKYPALLSMAPYMKSIQQQSPELSHSIEAGDTSFFVSKGYVHVIAQSRGTGFSQGQYGYYSSEEQQDGYELIEWIAQQPWCIGNVGMIGDSYYARMQYLVAAQQPPHLKCIAPWDASADLYRDTTYKGGLYWGDFFSMYTVDTTWQAIWPGPVEGKLTPVNLAAELALHSNDGPWYWERSAAPKVDKIKVPVLSMATQCNMNHTRGQLAIFQKISSPKKLVVAPRTGFFSHIHFHFNRYLKEQLLRWYEYWLQGIDTGIMDEPMVAIYDFGTEEYRYENEYPLSRTKWTKYHLQANGEGGAGVISEDLPAANEKPDKFRMPDSMREQAAGKPVLAYTSSPLKDDMRVWGPLSMVIYGSSNALDTAWFVKLVDIGLDGQVKPLTQGWLRASYRDLDEDRSNSGQPYHPFQKQVLLEAGKVYEFQIEMIPIFYTFKAGHKMRIEIASDDPSFRVDLHTIDVQLLPIPAENVVYHDQVNPSHILLPVIPDALEIKPVGLPIAGMKWPFVPGTTWPANYEDVVK